MQATKIPLKYLFTATYADGRVIKQTPEDVSLIDPAKRSCFFDVMEHEKVSPLLEFTLEGAGHRYSLNLVHGGFEIDGVKFSMSEGHIHYNPNGKRMLLPLTKLKIIFFRQHTHSFNVGAVKQEETSHEVAYRIGWECEMPCGHTQREVMQFE